jgi:hypothetical protein
MNEIKILVNPYEVTGFIEAAGMFNNDYRHMQIQVSATELPIDDDGFVFWEITIMITKGNISALLFLGRYWAKSLFY